MTEEEIASESAKLYKRITETTNNLSLTDRVFIASLEAHSGDITNKDLIVSFIYLMGETMRLREEIDTMRCAYDNLAGLIADNLKNG